ncbi:acid protease, partial [Glonium stellatum]
YVTKLTLGTPPQSFRVTIDIQGNNLFIPSISCTNISCNDHAKYNSSKSSTYVANDTRVSASFYKVEIDGRVPQDTLNVAGLSIKKLLFCRGR